MTLVNKIKDTNTTVSKFAKSVGVSDATIYNISNGRQSASNTLANRIDKKLGVVRGSGEASIPTVSLSDIQKDLEATKNKLIKARAQIDLLLGGIS